MLPDHVYTIDVNELSVIEVSIWSLKKPAS